MKPETLTALQTILSKEQCLLEEPMKQHTTFRVGGPAKALLLIEDEVQLRNVLAVLHAQSEKYMLLGNGSNLLVSDTGYAGVMLQLVGQFCDIAVAGTTLIAGAGALMSKVAQVAASHALAGMAFAAGIPGTIGGGILMNAGAYDGEMSQVTTCVHVMNAKGEVRILSGREMEFAYRHSVLQGTDDIVLRVEFTLTPGNEEEIRAMMDDFGKRRREKQPLEYPSAGSTFKRPEGMFAGKLIMDAGLRGFRIGGAQVSEKHCGFVINTGDATAQDVYRVMQAVQEKVSAQFQVQLEPEVIQIGSFEEM